MTLHCPLCLVPMTPADVASTGACLRCHEDGADAALRSQGPSTAQHDDMDAPDFARELVAG